ncbi:ribosomal protection-like ABC-F family protein [Bacillus sp. CECT 9360]|uniref:ribosomal protection-like ABC-F family protein n=1 Tax=Bacillus sp. CECT 9360 TaxID=2845821 RepID=UPI001E53C57E|nr:ABC-F type ribosomal protection protein [Bacillus sp. CECT 9360]CAH0345223.1 putative ABC transporter ATP-binding protein YheS [Bacillus sp. CECT 9360]
MIVCTIQQVAKMFGGHLIFDNLSFEIHEKDRIGLVGRNGGGKTTIMKIIAGAESADTGKIHLKKGTRVGYLAQIPSFPQRATGREVLMSAFSEALSISKRLSEYEERMSRTHDEKEMAKILDEYGILQEKFALLDGYEIEAKIMKVANGLKITALLEAPFISMSGGEQTKLCLGLILLQQPDLLLLDEPTNHLDISAVEWLEQFIKEYAGTVVTISHDRYFLDEIATKIIDLEDGEVTIYHENYSGFVKEKEKRLLEEFQAYQEQQKRIKKMKEAIRRLREWANQANPPNEGLHKRARNMERALERIEKLKRPILERKKMGLEFDAADRSGKDVIVVKDAAKSFGGKPLFHDASLHLQYKERAAIVGDNGTGKSTLLKMIRGEMTADVGEIRVGSNVKAGYLSQHLYTANGNMTVLEAFRDEALVPEGEARHILAGFLFYGPAVFRKVGQLSGGERMRLRLAQLMHQDINLLILDEPTNHLDIDSREVLEDALETFQGTILAVSHDRYLLNKLFDKTYWIEDEKLHYFTGNYSWARKKLNEIKAKQESGQESVKPIKKEPKAKPSSSTIEKEMERLEGQLEETERILAELNGKMEKEDSIKKLQSCFEQQESIEQRRDEIYRELEKYL